jgi:hypothetical protein
MKYLKQGLLVVIPMLVFAMAPARAADLTTQDYIDIEQLYAQYNYSIDTGDGEAWAATFTPDGTFNRFTGHDALVAFVKERHEKRNGANQRHWNSNLRITPSAEGADGKVLLMLVAVGAQPTIVMTGQYTDTLVKTPAGWRFKTRQVKSDAPPAPPKSP